jgi:hypothetical protein
MKSGRQRRAEIQAHRRKRAAVARRTSRTPWMEPAKVPIGALPADQAKLAHDNTYGPRPRYYVDKPFTCVDCGKEEVWTAADQKWWYEVAQGKILSDASRCLPCRRKRRLRRSQERRVHIEGLVTKYGLAEAARRIHCTVAELERMRARWTE